MKLNKHIGLLFGNKPDSRLFLPDSSLPMSNKYIGIEIESENIKYTNKAMNNLLGYWTVTTDGSLRNYGTEFVSAKLRGGDISLALEEINRVFEEYKITPEYSDRTSVHIHVDARFLTFEQLKVLILTYLIYEPFLFKYIGKDRENNSYCVPYYKDNNGLNNLARLFVKNNNPNSDIMDKELVSVAHHSVKYSAMNLKSLVDKGSIEFRAHYGTNDPAKILRWVKILLTFFKLSKEWSEEYCIHQLHKRDYKSYLEEIQEHVEPYSDIDLVQCAYTAKLSVAKLLIYANKTSAGEKKVRPRPRTEGNLTFGVLTSSTVDEAIESINVFHNNPEELP